MNFTDIKKIVIAEIDYKPLSDTKMYNFVLTLFNGNARATKKFLLSEGYTYGEINQVLRSKASKRYLNIEKLTEQEKCNVDHLSAI